MRVLFLDIDGVLNSQDWYRERQKLSHGMIRPPDDFFRNEDPHIRRQLWEIDPQALTVLKGIVEAFKLKIVISSAWRIGEDLGRFGYLFFRRIGWQVPLGTIIDKTPNIWGHDKVNIIRGDEVDHWLKNSPLAGDVGAYIIIDDNSDFHPHQKPNFLQTDGRYGLKDYHHDLVEAILERQAQ